MQRNIVYALDRLESPSPDFSRIQKRAESELGTSLHYRRIDVREVEELNKIVKDIADKHGRMDGLIAAAGIQQETPALDYSRKDCDTMMSINVTGVFMTAQAVARQMVRFEQGGSVVLIASMSGTVANRVRISLSFHFSLLLTFPGSHLPRIQCFKGSSYPTGPQSGKRMGPIRHSSKHDLSRLYRDCDGGGAI
jgi:NAD(P)-dependent dehydrogenase (short-subunit alcohol dehydrogenase family)